MEKTGFVSVFFAALFARTEFDRKFVAVYKIRLAGFGGVYGFKNSKK
jgi:hypothetical protein